MPHKIRRGSRVTWKSGPVAYAVFGTVRSIFRNAYGERVARVLWDGDDEAFAAHTSTLDSVED